MKGIGFKVKCKEDMEVFKPTDDPDRLELVIFFDNTIYTAIASDGALAVIDRGNRNVTLNNEIFNRHFNVI